jgi:hypothetical protein
MPPTTGGSTSGSSTRERRRPCSRNLPRARTRANGTPRTMHRTVLAADVRRLRPKADKAGSEVTRGTKSAQFTLATIANRGRITSRAARTATP